MSSQTALKQLQEANADALAGTDLDLSNLDVSVRQLSAAGGILSSSADPIGYAAGAGVQSIQLTSKSSSVTVVGNKPSGMITMNNESIAAGASKKFTVITTACQTTDTVIVNLRSGYNTGGSGSTEFSYLFAVCAVGINSFQVRITNLDAVTAFADNLIFTWAVIKAPAV